MKDLNLEIIKQGFENNKYYDEVISNTIKEKLEVQSQLSILEKNINKR